MKAAVFYGKNDLRVEERDVPEIGRNDVLVRVHACGICGTDVHIFCGDEGAAPTAGLHFTPELLEKIKQVRMKYKICREVTFGEGDNELYVDLENVLSVRTFLSRIKKYSKLTLSEFIFGSFESPVTDGENFYANEFLIPLFKNN